MKDTLRVGVTGLGSMLAVCWTVWAVGGQPGGGELDLSIRPGSEAGGLNVRSSHAPGELFDFRTCEGVLVGTNDLGLFRVRLPSEFGDGHCSWKREGDVWGYTWPYEGGVTVQLRVQPEGDSLRLTYTLTNTGRDVLDAVQLHTCVTTTEAPGFFPAPRPVDGQTRWAELYDRLYLWSGGRAFTFAESRLAKHEAHLSLMRQGATPIDWAWWVNGPETFDLPLIALTHREGGLTVALAFEQAVWASANVGDDRACFHLFPWFGSIEPGRSATVHGRLDVLVGGPQMAWQRFKEDFPSLPAH